MSQMATQMTTQMTTQLHQPQQQQQQRPSEKLVKRTRRKKDPNAPKRPKSAFIFFMMKNRIQIIAARQLNKKRVTEIGKAVGEAWRSLSAADRKEYDVAAAADKLRYAQENSDFKSQNPVIKKPISAYMFYVQERRPSLRAENPNEDFAGLGKLLGQKWKALDSVEKAPFQMKADADKMRYVGEIAAAPEPLEMSPKMSGMNLAQRI